MACVNPSAMRSELIILRLLFCALIDYATLSLHVFITIKCNSVVLGAASHTGGA